MVSAETMASEVHEVVLPSLGLFYGDKLPEGRIRVRPLTTREEKLLVSSKAATRNQLINKIVSDCILEEDRRKLPFDELLIGDVIYLFIFIRSITYGEEYTFFPACKYCNKAMKVDVTLPHQLGLYKFTPDHKEPFSVTLPKSGKQLKVRLLRISDEQAIDEYAKRHRHEEDPEFSYRIARHIVQIEDKPVENPCNPDVIRFVEDLHALDAEAIRETVINNDCGVDLEMDRDCEHCGRPNCIYFEMTVDFFRSQSSKVRRRRGTIG